MGKCAALCDEDDRCVGMEINDDADHCWITRTGHHCTDKQHHKWVSCKKGFHDECLDGYPGSARAPGSANGSDNLGYSDGANDTSVSEPFDCQEGLDDSMM